MPQDQNVGEEHEIEIWVAMDTDGDYALAKSGDDIDESGDDADLKPNRRLVCIKAKMHAPTCQELRCTIPPYNPNPVHVMEVNSVKS